MYSEQSSNIKNLRRTIGSFDYEQGNQFKINFMGFGASLQKFEVAPGAYFEWDSYSLFLFDHNVLRLKLAAGYHHLNDKILQAQYFFGGFGNREIENEPVRQYEKVFRFPGVPIYTIPTDNFIKLMYSNIFPPDPIHISRSIRALYKEYQFICFQSGINYRFAESPKVG